MNPIVAGLLAWLLLGLQLGLAETLRLGEAGPTPDLLLVLMAFVALHAPSRVAGWTALALGGITDMTWAVPLDDGGSASMLGPHMLGYVLASQAIVALRANLIRRNPLTLGAVTLLAGLISGAVVVAIVTFRDAYDPLAWRAGAELLTRLGSAGYSGVAAVILAFALLPLTPVMGFGPTRRN